MSTNDCRTAAGLDTPALALVGVDRTFGATHAVRALDLALHAGTVHALVGENGAGKSTAGKMAAGVIPPSAGSIEVDGVTRDFGSARDAETAGIVLVPQELLLYDSLSVLENLFVGRRRPRGPAGLLDDDQMRELARGAMGRLGLDVPLGRRVGTLSPGTKQLVTIARALVGEARVLVLDEPTAALDEWEAQRLLTVVDSLRTEGVAVLYVSHRLHEVLAIADTVSVMRDGALVRSAPVHTFDQQTLVEQMLGRELTERPRTESHAGQQVMLAARGLTREGAFADVDLEVRQGEVVGVAGIVGAGRSELARVLFGIDRPTSGTIEVDGSEVTLPDVRAAVEMGIAYVPEERQSQGLFNSLTVEDNIAVSSLKRLSRWGWVGPGAVRALADTALAPLALRGRLDDLVSSLSGGNQQKVVLAKWLATEPRIVILDEPTRGIDVGARSEIYGIVERLAAQGCAVVVISSDLQELLLISTRVLVMREGRMVGEFADSDMTEQAIGGAALGVAPGSAAVGAVTL